MPKTPMELLVETYLHPPDLSCRALCVYRSLLAHKNSRNGRCTPSVRTIAHENRIGLDSVRAGRRECVQKGLISFEAEPGKLTSYSPLTPTQIRPVPESDRYPDPTGTQIRPVPESEGRGTWIRPHPYLDPTPGVPESDPNRERTEKEQRKNRGAPEDFARNEVREIEKLWNEICGEIFGEIIAMTEDRRVMVESRLVAFPDLDWAATFRKLVCSSHHCGENRDGWKADFNWLMKADGNVAKIAERKETVDDYVPVPKTDLSKLPDPGKPRSEVWPELEGREDYFGAMEGIGRAGVAKIGKRETDNGD